MSSSCTPGLVGVASLVSVIWLPFKNGQNFLFWPWTMVVEKFNLSEPAQKIHAGKGWYRVHAHRFWWVWPLWFRRYGYLSKTAKFSFLTMDYSPWSWRKLIDRNRLKKFMQVRVDIECMCTDFSGHGLSGFGDIISLWFIIVEKFNRSELAQEIHASKGWCQVHVRQVWWVWLLWFRRYGYLSKTAKFSFLTMDYSPWSWRKLIDRNRLKKFMQVRVDVKFMYARFGGRGLSGFGDMATFQKQPIFPFWPWTIVHGCGKS